MLADDLGLEPGPRLQELERQVLQHDPALRAAPAGNLPSLQRRARRPRRGRRRARAGCSRHERLVEVVGPGGIGKTALAIATGRTLPGSVWLARLEAATTADDVLDTVIAALNVTGGEAALLERLRAARTVLVLDNCEHVLDAAAALAVRLLDAAPALQDPRHQPGRARRRRRGRPRARAARARRRGRALHAPRRPRRRRPDASCAARSTAFRWRSSWPRPARRTLSVEEIARRLDDRFSVLSDPTSRKPERRRALRATIGWSYELLFPDDQRGLWALATFAGGAPLAAVESVLEALGRPGVGGDRRRRAARRPLARDRRRRRATGCSTASARSRSRRWATRRPRGLDAHAAWFAAAAARSTAGVRSARQAEYLAFARTERANIDAALAWSAAHDPLRALAIANGFGWAWIVLGDSRGAQRLLDRARRRRRRRAAPRDRATALLLAAWIEASSGDLEPARRHVDEAAALADGRRARGPLRLLPRLRRLPPRRLGARAGADRSRRRALRRPRPPVGPGRERALRRARRDLGRRRRARRAPPATRSSAGCASSTTRGCTSAATRCSASSRALEHRFDDAVGHIAPRRRDVRPARLPARPRPTRSRAWAAPSARPGTTRRAPRRSRAGIAKAEATGDVRLAALGRVHLGRVLRALGRTAEARAALERAAAFHRSAGGGEQAALGDCLLAALDAPTACRSAASGSRRCSRPPAATATRRSRCSRSTRSAAPTTPRTAAMAAASHFITERDRTDRRAGAPRRTPRARR